MNLKEYNEKRDFAKTPEPKGETPSEVNVQRFVIQRHQARALHYDLRLEINGTLKSWAIPKGPSMNPNDKRLAVRTEDHPIKYLHFHGTITKGNYGAGEIIIWDSGTFEIDRTEMDMPAHEQLAKGNLKLIFHGKFIKGNFALVKTGMRNGKESWLLIKKKDAFSTDSLYNAEALGPSSDPKTKQYPKTIQPNTILQPMLASSTKEIFNDPDWLYELKWDGYRVLAHISDKGVLLQLRNGINLNTKFPKLAKELESIEHECILDGEVVILDESGVSQFGELQNYPDSMGVLRLYVFDMIYLNGISMLDLPLTDRKSLIPEVIQGLELTKYCDHIEGMGAALYQKAIDAGMEGVMAKLKDSTYTLATRTEKWLKIKSVDSLDALICGYTDSVGGGVAFGSLILGVRVNDEFTYIGNCGSGFSENRRKELLRQFEPYRRDENPFGKKLPLKGRKPNWMVPTLSCEVNFSERTKNGLLRNPVFERLLNAPVQEADSVPKRLQRKSLPSREIIEIDGLPVSITNIEKVYWPDSGLTKYDLIDYYLQVSKFILPHLFDRPQSLHRHPNGILEEGFYQKDNENVPEWMQTFTLYSKSSERDIEYLLCQNTASLIYMANLGCIEINPWNSRVGKLDFPDYGIIDLDPPEGMKFKNVVRIAKEFKSVMDIAEIQGYCKTSGSKGLHIYIPMGAKYTYEEVRNFIKLLCYFVQQRLPRISTLERRIKKREGKIYLDYLQNRKGHTVASVYSVRPLAGAPLSMPIEWSELDGKFSAQEFKMKNMIQRLERLWDLFQPLLTESINMESCLENLKELG
ncbi:DNA ligase D [Costertonia aggregata]|uniref:DNA ligase (ATP) n=1 Tax=Costertonia aggregata TaxID=343403 RepID=A0A7H9ASQ0_9FLAO|nr:DNA ligase D [Costertonia aggregata]QLG46511.1 DNA ligase D [Costertonia aggregata]